MNPFTLSFGKEPISAIGREKQIDEIVKGFVSENPEFQVCMLTGLLRLSSHYFNGGMKAASVVFL